MRGAGLNDRQILLRMMVSTSKDFTARLSDTRDQNFDLSQIADISKFFYQHDQRYVLFEHIASSKDIGVLIEFLNMLPVQGEKSFHNIFNEYLSKTFEDRKAVAINVISTLIEYKSNANHVYAILNHFCHSCDEVYSVFKEANSKVEIDSNLKLLYETLTPDLLKKLFTNKSHPSAPLNGQIQNKAWLSRVVASLASPDNNCNHNQIFELLNICLTCDEIYSVIKEANPNQTNEVSSNIIWLHSILSDNLLVKLFSGKCPESAPFVGNIDEEPWLIRLLETQIPSLVSAIFKLESIKLDSMFDEYTSKIFEERKAISINVISTLVKRESIENHVYTILNHLCHSCDEIYSVIKEVNPNPTNEISSNIIWLHSVLSDDLLVKLFKGKCPESATLVGNIDDEPWLIRLLETQISSLVSAIFKLESIQTVIEDKDEATYGISHSLVNLLLDKTDNYKMIRREFLQILTLHYKDSRDSAINYVKKYSSHTSSVTKFAVEEIKGQYDFTSVEKLTFFLSLFFTFLLSSAFYCFDVGADYSLVIQSGNCTKLQITNVSMPNGTTYQNQIYKTLNASTLSDVSFCESTVGAVPNYWTYTVIACILPFILNSISLGIETFRNKSECILVLPINIAKIYWPEHHSKGFYVLLTCSLVLWTPILILFYPIATKIAFMFLEYHIFVNARALNTTSKNVPKLYVKNNKIKRFHITIINELVKSSTLEVVTEATFQPLIQLYSLIDSNPYESFDPSRLLDNSFTSNAQVFSILTSIISFCWSLTAYHAYMKRGALDLGIGLKARLLLFASILLYIVPRIFILALAGKELFGNFDCLLCFLMIHLLLMAIIHIVDLKMLNVPSNYLSLDVWMEIAVNGFGSTLMPNKIKFCRFNDVETTSNPNASTRPLMTKVNERYHEKTSFRYLIIDTVFFIENLVLVFWCWNNWNGRDTMFTNVFPLWTIGLLLLSLICRFLYYQQHSWPIPWDEPILFLKDKFCSEPRSNSNVTQGHVDSKDGNEILHRKFPLFLLL